MSIDSKALSPNENSEKAERRSVSPSAEPTSDNAWNSSATEELNQLKSSRTDQSASPRVTRSHSSHSHKASTTTPLPEPANDAPTQRPVSPQVRHRTVQQATVKSTPHPARARSNSPQKTFSYLTSDRMNIRKWKDHRRQLAKDEEDNRIYYENRQKLERLAKIAKEPSTYPSIHVEQERLRERHAANYRRQLTKNYLPILRDNLCIVNRLANVKGVYDIKRMDNDFARHQQILKQDAANRQKARETAAQRPFILPKIHTKS